jgi:ribokinase
MRARRHEQYRANMAIAARLTVLGSLNMDISVTVSRLPQPGETVLGGKADTAPGGKGGNQAVAMARLGARVRMIGCVGDDAFGRTVRAALKAEGVDDTAVRTVAQAATGVAMITVDKAGENMITVAPGANREVGPAEVAASAGAGDALVISAEVPLPAIRAALAAAADPANPAAPPLTILNLAPAPPGATGLVRAAPDWLVVNQAEAAAILCRPVTGLDDAARAAADLVQAGARNAVVTVGAAGAAYCATGDGQCDCRTVPGFTVSAVDSVGAGDTFVGALAVTLAAGLAPFEAVTAAAAAGAAAVTRPGTQTGMPRPADVGKVTGHPWPLSIK